MLTCDRESLMMHFEGVLLERTPERNRVQDEGAVERALDAVDAGEVVALTVEGRIVSTVKLRERDGEEIMVESAWSAREAS